MLKSFIYILRGYGLPAGLGAILDFYRGLRLGLVQNLDELFDLGALCFVKRVRQMDLYERAFVYFFCGVDLPPVAEGDPAVLQSKQFREWLSQAVLSGQIQPVTQNLSPAELMERFWQTVREQMEAHHGGDRWVGTGGTSPFGHSGFSQAGIRVQGSSKYRSAMRVFGDRRYINYSEDLMIDDAPLARILETLRRLRPRGAATELNIAESVYQSARNAGVAAILVGCPDLQIAAGREHHIRESPLIGFSGVVADGPTVERKRLRRRIVELEPVGRITVLIFEKGIRSHDLVEHNRLRRKSGGKAHQPKQEE